MRTATHPAVAQVTLSSFTLTETCDTSIICLAPLTPVDMFFWNKVRWWTLPLCSGSPITCAIIFYHISRASKAAVYFLKRYCNKADCWSEGAGRTPLSATKVFVAGGEDRMDLPASRWAVSGEHHYSSSTNVTLESWAICFQPLYCLWCLESTLCLICVDEQPFQRCGEKHLHFTWWSDQVLICLIVVSASTWPFSSLGLTYGK